MPLSQCSIIFVCAVFLSKIISIFLLNLIKKIWNISSKKFFILLVFQQLTTGLECYECENCPTVDSNSGKKTFGAGYSCFVSSAMITLVFSTSAKVETVFVSRFRNQLRSSKVIRLYVVVLCKIAYQKIPMTILAVSQPNVAQLIDAIRINPLRIYPLRIDPLRINPIRVLLFPLHSV
jgi:hypothetical protein